MALTAYNTTLSAEYPYILKYSAGYRLIEAKYVCGVDFNDSAGNFHLVHSSAELLRLTWALTAYNPTYSAEYLYVQEYSAGYRLIEAKYVYSVDFNDSAGNFHLVRSSADILTLTWALTAYNPTLSAEYPYILKYSAGYRLIEAKYVCRVDFNDSAGNFHLVHSSADILTLAGP